MIRDNDSPKSTWEDESDDETDLDAEEGEKWLRKDIPFTDTKWLTDDVRRLRFPWTVWFHFPHDTNWAIDSYTQLCTFDTLEMMVAVMKSIETISVNCMVFVKEDIQPLWEHGKQGQRRILVRDSRGEYDDVWNSLVFLVVGGTLLDSPEDMSYVNGITISPKKNFHIVECGSRRTRAWRRCR